MWTHGCLTLQSYWITARRGHDRRGDMDQEHRLGHLTLQVTLSAMPPPWLTMSAIYLQVGGSVRITMQKAALGGPGVLGHAAHVPKPVEEVGPFRCQKRLPGHEPPTRSPVCTWLTYKCVQGNASPERRSPLPARGSRCGRINPPFSLWVTVASPSEVNCCFCNWDREKSWFT